MDNSNVIVASAQVVFTILTGLCTVFDFILLISVLRMRFSTTKRQPFVYIVFMGVIGCNAKIVCLMLVDSVPIANYITPNGYEELRALIGKQITIIGTHAYLSPLCLNFLMTINRVWVMLKPFDTRMFSETRLAMYCSAIVVTLVSNGTQNFKLSQVAVFISLLIPFLSPCYINIDSRIGSFVSGCAPDRHPITLFQNKYAIWLPITAMFINFAIILQMKFRRLKDNISIASINSQKTRENAMIRQAAFIASWLSVYELVNLYIRLFPENYQKVPKDYQYCFFCFRLFFVYSLNFFIYFVETRSTRQIVLKFLGLDSKSKNRTVFVNVSHTLTAN